MKRFLLVFSFMMLAASTGFAQDKTVETRVEIDSATGQRRVITAETLSKTEDITPRNNMIVINPLKFFYMYNLSFYHRLSNSVVVGGGLQTPAISYVKGFGVLAEVRLHPSGKAMRGFYVAPNVSYNSIGSDFEQYGGSSSESITTSSISVGGLVGWQWFWGDDFALGLGIGMDYYFLSGSYQDENGSDPFSSYSGTFPALRFDIGYAW